MSVSSVGSSNPYSYLQWPLQPDERRSERWRRRRPIRFRRCFSPLSGGGIQRSAARGASARMTAPASSPALRSSARTSCRRCCRCRAVKAAPAPRSCNRCSASSTPMATARSRNPSSRMRSGRTPTRPRSMRCSARSTATATARSARTRCNPPCRRRTAASSPSSRQRGGAGQQGGSDPLQALLSGASADGTTSQSATNADGSTTTTITYADGTKVEMTTPAAPPSGCERSIVQSGGAELRQPAEAVDQPASAVGGADDEPERLMRSIMGCCAEQACAAAAA